MKIYALTDPKTHRVRYVGATSRPLLVRLAAHLSRATQEGPTTAKNRWLRSIQRQGLCPLVMELETVLVDDDWEYREQWWIALWNEEGDLLNETAGGVGAVGLSAAARRKIASSLKGREPANKGKPGRSWTPEERERASQQRLGVRRDPEVKRRIAEGLREFHARRGST